MKVIDLLNKIANGEEVPKYVQYYNILQGKLDTMMVCKENIYYKLDNLEIQINSRVEPLEEPKGIPEKLEEPRFNKGRYYIKDINGDDSEISGIERTFRLKINEILDYLKSKGDE